MWGLQIVIALKYRENIMAKLHNCHPRIARMKGLARIHIRFPNIDKQIEEKVIGIAWSV